MSQFERTRLLIGDHGLERLRAAHVMVVGQGAVGSFATEALARAGVGRLTLVDFDSLGASNLNRQLFALHSTLGRPKVQVAAERVADINPACRVEARELFVADESLDNLLAEPPNVLVDAIDALGPKVALLEAALHRGIVTVTSMGAAVRTDPTQVRVGSLAEASVCPLAKRVRKRLRKRGVEPTARAVWSVEPANRDALGHQADDDPGIARGRARRPLGSLPTITGIFGLCAANEALRLLLGGNFRQ